MVTYPITVRAPEGRRVYRSICTRCDFRCRRHHVVETMESGRDENIRCISTSIYN